MVTEPFSGAELETVLADYEQQLAILRAALTEGESSAAWQMLVNGTLAGETERLAGVAARQTSGLWVMVDTVGERLDEARQRLDNHGAEPKPVESVYKLLEGVEPDAYTVGELLDECGRRHDHLRSWATRITGVWLAVAPSIDGARTTLDFLSRYSEALDASGQELAKVRQRVDDLQHGLTTDPLSVAEADGVELDAEIAQLARHVTKSRSQQDSLEHEVGDAAALLAALRAMRAKAAAVWLEAEPKVVTDGAWVKVPSKMILDGPNSIGEQLETIIDSDCQLKWDQRRSLLDRWKTTARNLEKQLRRAFETNSEPLRKREELRGRLIALRAKMSTTGQATNPELAGLADQIRSELYTAPSDLELASKGIDELMDKLQI